MSKKSQTTEKEFVYKKKAKILRRRKPNRSRWGDLFMYLFLLAFGIIMAIPLVYAISCSLKPLDELFIFPPKFFAKNPTIDNFTDLFVAMSKSWVTFPRYFFNTVFLTFIGTLGHVVLASMAAFILSKYSHIPLAKGFFVLVTTALMFNGYVTSIPNYVIMNKLHMIDTYWALIIPAWGGSMGLFLMKQFMDGLPDALVEAARIDGAKIHHIFLQIVMPNVKPAWLTLIIFCVRDLWNNRAANVIYSEEKKTLVFALQQITSSGAIARTGQGFAVSVFIMIVPITIFIISQSQILETMASSGMKD